MFAVAFVFGCSSGDDEQQSLEAILNDGDLTTLMSSRGLAAAAVGGKTGGTGGTAGIFGSGGTAGIFGSGGAVGTAGIGMTGTGGAVGSGGSFDGGVGGGPFDGGMGGSFDGGVGGGSFDGGVGGGIGSGGSGMGGNGFPFPEGAQGQWTFDDCNSARTDLGDSTFSGHTAFRSVTAACTTGVVGQAIAIDETNDLVYVPDQPSFTFENGVSVAAWVKPTKLGDVRTIFRKREGGTSTFVLAANDKDYQMVVRLVGGRAISVQGHATPNSWTHVAATYDG
ncbi:MAG TPA: LamG-like jellyroll fold domain-containing protein, partial [Polyangia bacterium]